MTTAGTRVDGSILAMADLPSWSMCWELLFSLALPVYVIVATDMRFVAPIALACVLLSEWTQWPPLRHMAMFALGVALAKRLTDNGRETMRDVVAVPLALCGIVLVCQSGFGLLLRYCRPTFGRVRMPDIGGGRTYLQRGIRPAFHATCPLAGAHFIQPVSDPSSSPRLDCAVHSRAGSIAPGGFRFALCLLAAGGVLSCRGTACYQTVKEAGKGEKGSLMYSACAWCFRRNAGLHECRLSDRYTLPARTCSVCSGQGVASETDPAETCPATGKSVAITLEHGIHGSAYLPGVPSCARQIPSGSWSWAVVHSASLATDAPPRWLPKAT